MLIGRGILDDKGPLWASVFAARCLKELGLLPKRKLEFFCGSDEECGMEDIEYYKKTSKKLPVVAFTPDGSYPICHGEKGIMDFTLDIPAEGANIVDFVGGAAHNIVPTTRSWCSPASRRRMWQHALRAANGSPSRRRAKTSGSPLPASPCTPPHRRVVSAPSKTLRTASKAVPC